MHLSRVLVAALLFQKAGALLKIDGQVLKPPESEKHFFDVLGVDHSGDEASFYNGGLNEKLNSVWKTTGPEVAHEDEESMHYVIKYNPNKKSNSPTNMAKQDSSHQIPNMIMQLGTMRTATTLQFQSLCATMVLLHPGNTRCKFGGAPDFPKQGQYSVFKTHSRAHVDSATRSGRPFWLFVTSKIETKIPESEALAEIMGVSPEYVQTLPVVQRKGWAVVADYAPIFRLSDDQTQQFLNYMEPWSLLRQCCGSQMSKTWRRVLQHDVPESECPVCQNKDLNAVESKLIANPIFRQMRTDNIVQDSAQAEQHMNGAYCTWFNRQVECQHLSFNDLPQSPGC